MWGKLALPGKWMFVYYLYPALVTSFAVFIRQNGVTVCPAARFRTVYACTESLVLTLFKDGERYYIVI